MSQQRARQPARPGVSGKHSAQPPQSEEAMLHVALRNSYRTLVEYTKQWVAGELVKAVVGSDVHTELTSLFAELAKYKEIISESSIEKYIKLIDDIANPAGMIHTKLEVLQAKLPSATSPLMQIDGAYKFVVGTIRNLSVNMLNAEKEYLDAVYQEAKMPPDAKYVEFKKIIEENSLASSKVPPANLIAFIADLSDPSGELMTLRVEVEKVQVAHISKTPTEIHASVRKQHVAKQQELSVTKIVSEYYPGGYPGDAARKKAEEDARKKAEDDAKAEEARKKAEEDARKKAEDDAKAEEARKKAEEDAKAEEARKKAEEDAKQKAAESEKQDIEKHLADYFTRLKDLESKDSLNKCSGKAKLVREGLEYLKKVSAPELVDSKYVLSVNENKGWFNKKSLEAKLESHTLEDIANSACESTKSIEVANIELNQAIGWIEYLNIKKAHSGGDLNKEIEKVTKGEITLATKMAYIEDTLKSHPDYKDINVQVTYQTKGVIRNGVGVKEETLAEFIETNLKHAAEDMYSHNVGEGLDYISQCMDAIQHYDPVMKAGIVIDMSHLAH